MRWWQDKKTHKKWTCSSHFIQAHHHHLEQHHDQRHIRETRKTSSLITVIIVTILFSLCSLCLQSISSSSELDELIFRVQWKKRDGTSFEQTHKRKMCNILIYHNAMLMKLSSSKKKGLTKGRKDGEPKRGNNSVIQIPTKMKRRMHTVMPSSTRVSLWQKFKQIWEFDKLDNFSPTGSRFVYAVRDATWLHNLSLWIHFNILVIDSKSIITGSTRVHISCPFIECSKKKPFSKQWERLNAQQTRHHSCLWVFLTRRVVWQQKNEGDTWLSRH